MATLKGPPELVAEIATSSASIDLGAKQNAYPPAIGYRNIWSGKPLRIASVGFGCKQRNLS
jgi:hypothetical protein